MEIIGLRKDIVEWMAQMALRPAWVEYMRDMVKRYDQDPTGLFRGIAKEVSARVKELKNETGTN